MSGCGVRRGGKYAGGLVQRYGALLGNRQAQIDAAVEGKQPAPPGLTRVSDPAPVNTSTMSPATQSAVAGANRTLSGGQSTAPAATWTRGRLSPKEQALLSPSDAALYRAEGYRDGAVIPGHDEDGSDDVPVKVTRGEAILPVKTVDAMGGPMAVSDMIHATNGKPPAGVRRGGEYADGAEPSIFAPGSGMRSIEVGRLFGTRPLSALRPLPLKKEEQAPDYGNEGRSVSVPITASPATSPAAPTVTPTAAPAPTPSSDSRLAALGVKSDWRKMTEAADQPVKNAEIHTKGRSAAGYGTQTPEMEAAANAKAEANRKALAGTYERESQARLGASIAAARLRGEDSYADALERELERKERKALEKAKVSAASEGSSGLGELRAAQTGQITQELKQGSTKQAMTDEYLNPGTAPERRKILAATLGIKPESGWQINAVSGPLDPITGQPTKSTIAYRTTASGELETRDLSGGAAQTGTPMFNSVAEVQAAKAAGKIKSGDIINTPNGPIRTH